MNLKALRDSRTPFFIAEVGANHQGDLELAKRYIRTFAQAGASAIKFQKRDNITLFAKSAFDKPYNSNNSFGRTYGEHRQYLELELYQLEELKDECKNQGVYFMCTAFDEVSANGLIDIGVDILKVASFDIGNISFLEHLAATAKPLVLSTGGGSMPHITASVEAVGKYHSNVAVLHCVSKYPCEFSELRLTKISRLRETFPDITIGLSDHFNGILSGPVGYLEGARIFEKHVTLNRAWKGSDHSFALEPDGYSKFVRDTLRVSDMGLADDDEALGTEEIFARLGKSLVITRDKLEGSMIESADLSGKVFEDPGIPVRESVNLIGKKIALDIKKGTKITWNHFR